MRIRVTEEHIRRGEAHSYDRCPVGLATREALGIEGVEVNKISIRRGRGGDLIVRTPDSVLRFIEDFDNGVEVHPFEFEIPDFRDGI